MATYRKRWEVIRNTDHLPVVDTGKRKLRWGKSDAFTVGDAGEAAAIKQKYGGKKGQGEVVVVETGNTPVEKGHKYTFSTLALPYAKYDELGRRLHDRKENTPAQSKAGPARAENWRRGNLSKQTPTPSETGCGGRGVRGGKPQ